MTTLIINAGRKFFGICLVVQGIVQMYFADFRKVFVPSWPEWRTDPGIFWVYLGGGALIGAGIAIIVEKKAREVALILGGIFLMLVVFWHIPYMLLINPNTKHLGVWAEAGKALAYSGGAFVLAGTFNADTRLNKPSLISLLEKFIPFGGILFAITMITFGIDHLLYTENISTLVPAWIPGKIFWTYLAAAALIGSGVSIITKIQLRLVGTLMGIMILLWFFLLHIPRAIADPITANGNEIASAADALAFSGIAFMLAFSSKFQVQSYYCPGNSKELENKAFLSYIPAFF